MTKWGGFWSGFGFRMSMALNIGLCIDVVMTLRFPFTSQEKRMNIILVSSVAFALLALFANGLVGQELAYHFACVATGIVIVLIYPVIAIGSIIYVIIKLREPHMSLELQKTVLWWHIL